MNIIKPYQPIVDVADKLDAILEAHPNATPNPEAMALITEQRVLIREIDLGHSSEIAGKFIDKAGTFYSVRKHKNYKSFGPDLLLAEMRNCVGLIRNRAQIRANIAAERNNPTD